MGRLVMKFGGTSVADIARIRNVARHVEREVKAGHHVAVVVSAMSGTTDRLVGWCREAAPVHDAREYDAVVASGEQVTAGLLAIVLQDLGIPARSWAGWQIPLEDRWRPWRRPHRRHRRRRDPQAHGTGPGGRDRRLPGHRPRQAHHHAGPWRVRHLGRGRCGGARCGLRHLYRRRRRLYGRPPHRDRRPEARPHLL